MLVSDFRFKTERLDFETHLQYVSLICDLSAGLKISGIAKPKLSKKDLDKLKDKIQLIKLTKISIDNEGSIVAFDKEYSTASVLWLPIKTYYLIYHLLCTIDCLISGKVSSLTAGHHDCVNLFTSLLEKGEIQFNNPRLNLVFENKILDFVTKSGEHLKVGVSEDIVYQLLMKKVANGKIENFKIVNGLSARKIKDKARIENFKSNLKISVFDFFHLMRLRMNYRNLNFVDNIPAKDTKVYFEKYHASSENFYKALSRYVNELIKQMS
jgi:hypothetical protein